MNNPVAKNAGINRGGYHSSDKYKRIYKEVPVGDALEEFYEFYDPYGELAIDNSLIHEEQDLIKSQENSNWEDWKSKEENNED